MNPIKFAMRHPITMLMLVVALLSLGGLAARKMRVDIFPEFDLPQIYIIQNFNGMSPSQMEGFIVNQLELNLQYVDGIKDVESQSIQQIALIKVSFYPGTNMQEAMAAVVAQVNRAQATMPQGILPPQIMRMDAGSVPVGYLVLTSKNVSMGILADIAEQNIRPLIQSRVPGTVGTAPFGANIRSIVVTVDPDRLRSYNLTPEDVVDALMSGNTIIPAGNLYIQDRMPLVPSNTQLENIQKMRDIPLRKGRNVYLRNVASISDSTDINYGYAMVDGKPSVYIPIVKKNTASTLSVVDEIHQSMDRFRSVLPEGVDIKYEFDESPTVVEAIRSVATEGVIGAGLTGLMVLIFLQDMRSVLVVVCNIPLALLGSLFGLYVTGNTTNIMTLGGLALAIGMLVDEATVEVENIHAQLERVGSLPRAVRLGNHITAVPRLLAMLCILSVFIPAFIMAEPVRSLFVPLSLAVGFSMITSYLLSSTLVPVLAVYILKDPAQAKHSHTRAPHQPGTLGAWLDRMWARMPFLAHAGQQERAPQAGDHGEKEGAHRGKEGRIEGESRPEGFFDRVRERFGKVVDAIIDWRWVVLPAYGIVCVAVLAIVGLELGTELFPPSGSTQLVLRFRMPPGTNYELTREAWVRCLEVLQEEVGPENVKISMGFAGQQAPNYGMNNMILFMRGPDDAQFRAALREDAGINIAQLQDKLRKALPDRLVPWLRTVLVRQGYTEADAQDRARLMRFGFEPGDIISQVMSFGSPTPIEVVVSGTDLSELRYYTEGVLQEMKKNRFLRDLEIHQELDYPTVSVQISREKAGLSGVTAEDVGKSLLVATSSSRMLARNYWLETKQGHSYQVQVQTPIHRMTSETQVETLPLSMISSNINLMVRDVASVKRGFMPGELDRTSMQRYLSITANVEGEDLGRAARQIEDSIQRAGKPPRSVAVESRGQVKIMNQMFESLGIGLGLSVFVILILLTAYFQSIRLAIVSVGAVPGVLCGVAVLLLVTGTTLNIESFMGTIMSVGVSVSNSVMLVTFMMMEWQRGSSVREAAETGARERLRPILMTACAMIIGMVPMSLGLESGSKMEMPLGRAVIGGLFLSTFATLLILPSLFVAIMGDRRYANPSIDPDDEDSSYYDGGEEAHTNERGAGEGGRKTSKKMNTSESKSADGKEHGRQEVPSNGPDDTNGGGRDTRDYAPASPPHQPDGENA